jgi:hypothetical protein
MTPPSSDPGASRPGAWARTAKVIAAVTAVITLVLGAHQVVTRVGGYLQQHREATTLTEAARQQAARGEYAEAWTSLERAATLSNREALAALRVDVAFAWLEEGRATPGKPFRSITDAVTPVLDQALTKAQGARRADILAHLGWAAFLRSRDGIEADPSARYQEALAIDPGNAYANAMLGHWLMWRGGEADAAHTRFTTALAGANAPQRPVVRRLQLAALMNRGTDAEARLFQVVNEMRERGEALEPRAADRMFALYAHRYGPRDTPRRNGDDPLPPAASRALFEWIVRTPGASPRSTFVATFVRSALQDAAGDRAAAVATLRELERTNLPPSQRDQVTRAITRLTARR